MSSSLLITQTKTVGRQNTKEAYYQLTNVDAVNFLQVTVR